MKHSIEKMRACLSLLPSPGDEVVAECLDEIEALRQKLQKATATIEGLNGRFEKDQDRIACQAEQLAAALAACKLKDEALGYRFDHQKVAEALAIKPDDSALKEWVSQRIASPFRKMK